MAQTLPIELEKLVSLYAIAGQRLQKQRIQRCMDEEFDACIKLLDVCAAAREAVSSWKLQAQNLRSALRTNRGVTAATLAYSRERRAVKEEGARFSKILKRLEKTRGGEEGLTGAAVRVFLSLSSLLVAQAQRKTKSEEMGELQRLLLQSEKELHALEAPLEAVFRVLIRHTVLLLNVLS